MLKFRTLQKFDAVNRFDRKGDRVSFCVYGTKLKYIVGAVHNVVLAAQWYPGWICRFYIQRKTQLIKVLTDMGAEVFVTDDIDFSFGQIHPVTWRFFAMADEVVDRAIFRDVDSRITEREALAVQEWISSGKQFHRMKEKDHINDPPIMSGMWGAKAERLRHIGKLLASYSDWQHPDKPFPGDFNFLENKVWPIVKEDCLFHGVSNDAYGKANPFPNHKPIDYGFVGSRVIDGRWGLGENIDE